MSASYRSLMLALAFKLTYIILTTEKHTASAGTSFSIFFDVPERLRSGILEKIDVVRPYCRGECPTDLLITNICEI